MGRLSKRQYLDLVSYVNKISDKILELVDKYDCHDKNSHWFGVDLVKLDECLSRDYKYNELCEDVVAKIKFHIVKDNAKASDWEFINEYMSQRDLYSAMGCFIPDNIVNKFLESQSDDYIIEFNIDENLYDYIIQNCNEVNI